MDIEGIVESIFTVAPFTMAPLPSLRVTVKVSAPFCGGSGANAVVTAKSCGPNVDEVVWESAFFELQPMISSAAVMRTMILLMDVPF